MPLGCVPIRSVALRVLIYRMKVSIGSKGVGMTRTDVFLWRIRVDKSMVVAVGAAGTVGLTAVGLSKLVASA
jgi:hypothetical protein